MLITSKFAKIFFSSPSSSFQERDYGLDAQVVKLLDEPLLEEMSMHEIGKHTVKQVSNFWAPHPPNTPLSGNKVLNRQLIV